METLNTMHKELAENAVTVECDKRYRYNHNAPAVVAKQGQSEVQFEWFVKSVQVNGVELSQWCDMVGVPREAFHKFAKTFKTKKAALIAVVQDFVDVLDRAAPEWSWQDEEDYPEYFRVIAALKGDK